MYCDLCIQLTYVVYVHCVNYIVAVCISIAFFELLM